MDWNTLVSAFIGGLVGVGLGFALFDRPVSIHLSLPRIIFTKDVFEELLQSVQGPKKNEQ